MWIEGVGGQLKEATLRVRCAIDSMDALPEMPNGTDGVSEAFNHPMEELARLRLMLSVLEERLAYRQEAWDWNPPKRPPSQAALPSFPAWIVGAAASSNRPSAPAPSRRRRP